MTAARILDRVQFGYGKAASKLGLSHTLYRPTAALTPALSPLCFMRRDVPFAVSQTPDAAFSRPAKYGSAIAFALMDVRGTRGSDVRGGDYIVGPTGTWFVASLEQLTIPMVIECNAVVSVARPAGNVTPGIGPYGGRKNSTDVPLMAGWPASVLLGGRTQAGRADLPADVQAKGFQILLPAWPGVTLRTSDRVTDDAGRAFTLGAAELSDFGWRLDAVMSVT